MQDTHASAGKAAFSGAASVVVITLLALLIAGWASSRPLDITIDGVRRSIVAGTTCSDLVDAKAVKARPGDLIGVDGSLVAARGGEAPRIIRNGVPAAPWQRVFDGDRIESRPGENRVESLLVIEEAIPFDVRYEGRGSIVQMASLGSPGLARITRGAISGEEVTRTVVREPRAQVFVRSGPQKGAKVVALTFDDGPEPGQTDRVLDVLAERQVHATFFVLGDHVTRYPALVRRAAAEGHQIANHSFSHKDFRRIDNHELRRQIGEARKRIRNSIEATQSTPWIRPPYGGTNARVWQVLRSEKQRVVMWDVDPQDWRRPGSGAIASNVIRNVKPGSVVLLHDGGPDRRQTIDALPRIIDTLRGQGYEFVTVEELAQTK